MRSSSNLNFSKICYFESRDRFYTISSIVSVILTLFTTYILSSFILIIILLHTAYTICLAGSFYIKRKFKNHRCLFICLHLNIFQLSQEFPHQLFLVWLLGPLESFLQSFRFFFVALGEGSFLLAFGHFELAEGYFYSSKYPFFDPMGIKLN